VEDVPGAEVLSFGPALPGDRQETLNGDEERWTPQYRETTRSGATPPSGTAGGHTSRCDIAGGATILRPLPVLRRGVVTTRHRTTTTVGGGRLERARPPVPVGRRTRRFHRRLVHAHSRMSRRAVPGSTHEAESWKSLAGRVHIIVGPRNQTGVAKAGDGPPTVRLLTIRHLVAMRILEEVAESGDPSTGKSRHVRRHEREGADGEGGSGAAAREADETATQTCEGRAGDPGGKAEPMRPRRDPTRGHRLTEPEFEAAELPEREQLELRAAHTRERNSPSSPMRQPGGQELRRR